MSETIELNLPVILPDVPDVRDRCVSRLAQSLSNRPGIGKAHVLGATDGSPHRLCVHYDSDIISLHRIRELAHSVGAELTDRFGHVVWHLSGVSHPRRARMLGDRLRGLNGVVEADASGDGILRVEFDQREMSVEELKTVLSGWGFDVDTADRREDQDGSAGVSLSRTYNFLLEHPQLVLGIGSGCGVALGFALSFSPVAGWVPLGAFILAYVLGGYHTVEEAIQGLRAGRFEVDLLMVVAALGAAALGRWFEGAFLLFLFSLGHGLEHYALNRAHEAISSLSDLVPETALVRRKGAVQEISVEDLQIGDEVVVKPNQRIPTDGVVVDGSSAVNEAPVTGESMPVDKEPLGGSVEEIEADQSIATEHRVYAGTINGAGTLEVRVTRSAGDTTLARVIELITEAETEKAPTERFVDRFERYFVPAVLLLAVALLFAWIPLDETFAASFYRSMAVLVAASPCALAIATPSAVLSAVARAGRGGVLVKGGAPLERLGGLTAFAFDKTGTLTEGRPQVVSLQSEEGFSERELLQTAATVERLSDHPLARALVMECRERYGTDDLPQVAELVDVSGKGVIGTIGDEVIYIGNRELFTDGEFGRLSPDFERKVRALEEEGQTPVIVRRGTSEMGLIGLMDAPRPDVTETLKDLREMGIRRTIMISGDRPQVAQQVARQIGIDEVYGGLLPDEKVDAVRDLAHDEAVAMVGDGVNDAPAIASAQVGIAMGAAGSDAALETAEVALMADRLDHLPFAVGLSRASRRIIRQNLAIALGMVLFLVPATILGLHIWPAVVLHEGSTLLVVANSLRLLRYQPS